jgi:hypothetical protein
MPDHNKLPVKKNTSIAASAAIGKAKRKPMMIAINAIMSRTISSHQKPGSVRTNYLKCKQEGSSFYKIVQFFKHIIACCCSMLITNFNGLIS